MSRIAVKINFLWGRLCSSVICSKCHVVIHVYIRNDMQNFTSVILYMNIIHVWIAQWLFGDNFEILHCSDAFSTSKWTIKLFQASVDFILPRKFSFPNYVTSTLMGLFSWLRLFSYFVTTSGIALSIQILVCVVLTRLARCQRSCTTWN